MCKQKMSNLMLVRVIITTILIIAMAVTSAPIVHAADESADQMTTTNSVSSVSTEYDALENRLKELEKEEETNGIDRSSDKAKIVEAQIVLLYNEIDKYESLLGEYSKENEECANKIEQKESRLDNRRKQNEQEIKTAKGNLAATCIQLVLEPKSFISVVDQMSMITQMFNDDKNTQEEIIKMYTKKEEAQNILENCSETLTTLNNWLVQKRQWMFDYCFSNAKSRSKIYLNDNSNSSIVGLHVDEETGVLWADPCEYSKLSSPFGYRIHPVYGGWRMHNGVDLTNKSRTPIYASRSGLIIDSGYDPSSGYHVTIDHLDGYQTTYLHLCEPSELKEGTVVTIGDQIGKMGTTGTSTGTHLHFGVSKNNTWVDPMDYIG